VGDKPVLKKLLARLDKYDTSIDSENQLVTATLRNKCSISKLLHCRDYIRKFISRKLYEVVISIDRQGMIRLQYLSDKIPSVQT